MQTGEQRLFTPNFVLAFVANFFLALNFSNNAIYPLYVTQEGGTADTIGVFMSLYAISAVLGRPVVGILIDRWGLKQTWVIGVMFMVLPALGYYFQVGHGMTPVVWGLRVIQGIGAGTHFTAFFTLAGFLAPPGRSNESIAKFGLSGMVAHIIGPSIGEQIMEHANTEVFLLTITGFGIIGIVLIMMLPQFKNPDLQKDLPTPKQLFDSFRTPGMIFTFILAIFLAVSFTTPAAFLAPVAKFRGITGFGLYFTAFSIGGIIIRLTGSHWADKYGPRRVLLPGFILYVGAMVVLSLAGTLPWIIVAGGLAGLAHGAVFPAVTALGYNLAPRAYRGSAMALVTGMMDAGGAITAFSLGYIAENYGYGMVFPSGAIGPVIALLVVLGSLLYDPKPVKLKSSEEPGSD